MDNEIIQEEGKKMCPKDPNVQCLVWTDVADLRSKHAKLLRDVNELYNRLRLVEEELARQGALSATLEQRLERIANSLDETRNMISAEMHKLSLLITGNAAASTMRHAADVEEAIRRDAEWSERQVKFVAVATTFAAAGAAAAATLGGFMFFGAGS